MAGAVVLLAGMEAARLNDRRLLHVREGVVPIIILTYYHHHQHHTCNIIIAFPHLKKIN